MKFKVGDRVVIKSDFWGVFLLNKIIILERFDKAINQWEFLFGDRNYYLFESELELAPPTIQEMWGDNET